MKSSSFVCLDVNDQPSYVELLHLWMFTQNTWSVGSYLSRQSSFSFLLYKMSVHSSTSFNHLVFVSFFSKDRKRCGGGPVFREHPISRPCSISKKLQVVMLQVQKCWWGILCLPVGWSYWGQGFGTSSTAEPHRAAPCCGRHLFYSLMHN